MRFGHKFAEFTKWSQILGEPPPGMGGRDEDERAKRCEVGGLAKEQVERSEEEEPRCKAAQAGLS